MRLKPFHVKDLVITIFLLLFISLIESNCVLASEPEDVLQQRTVRGRVVDTDNNSLAGVTVVLKGTTVGSTTDSNGNYSIQISPDVITPVLIFSFVGMETQEIDIGTQTTVNVTLAEALIALDEVVAIGYGTVKKSDLTGSVSTLRSDDYITAAAPANIGQMFQGRIAGMQVSTVSSDPGGEYLIRIRGTGSITAGNSPLYVIDGLPGAPLN